MENKLIVVSGFSGCGKGTLLDGLMALHPEIHIIKSYTTRPRRSETDYYTFVSKEEFLALRDKGKFLECNLYSGEWYGTPKDAVEQCFQVGAVPIVEIDPNGYKQILASPGIAQEQVLGLYVVADADTVYGRLCQRNTENTDKILKRLKTSLEECEAIPLYNATIANYELEKAVRTLEAAIFEQKLPTTVFDIAGYQARMKEIIAELEKH